MKQLRGNAEYGVGILLFVVLWEIGSRALGKPNLLPGPAPTLMAAVSLLASGSLEMDIWNSLSRVFQGFAIAAAVAIPLGGAMGMIPSVQRVAHPIVEVIRPIPPIAVIPLSILWFGIGDVAQVFIVFYGAFFPMVVGVYGAYINIDPIFGQAAETLGCHRIEKFWRVTFMAALPSVLIAMRIGIGLAFVSLVAAELIGASSGLGYLVATSATTFQIPNMFVGIITIGIVGFALSAIFNGLTRLVVHQQL